MIPNLLAHLPVANIAPIIPQHVLLQTHIIRKHEPPVQPIEIVVRVRGQAAQVVEEGHELARVFARDAAFVLDDVLEVGAGALDQADEGVAVGGAADDFDAFGWDGGCWGWVCEFGFLGSLCLL